MTTLHDLDPAPAKRFFYFIPLFLLVPVLYWLGFDAAGLPMNWKAFGLGAAGWMAALILRGPVTLLAQRFWPKQAENIVIGSSGPLEEGVRVALLLWTSTAFPWAAALGMGWAAIEVLFAVVNGAALAALVNRTDEKAMQARQVLAQRGVLNAHPLWGVMERISASGVHIGFTLIAAANPLFVVAAAPIHSAVNLVLTRLAARSMWQGQAAIAAAGAAAMITGLLLSR